MNRDGVGLVTPWRSNTAARRVDLIQRRLPDHIRDLELGTHPNVPVRVLSWLGDDCRLPNRSLILYGEPGGGKTAIGGAILKEYARRGLGMDDNHPGGALDQWNACTGFTTETGGWVPQPAPVSFFTWERACREWRRRLRPTRRPLDDMDEYRDHEFLDWITACKVQLLMLDDVDSGTFTPERSEFFHALMDEWEPFKERSLILTINHKPDKWPELFGERDASRLLSPERFRCVHISGGLRPQMDIDSQEELT
jgi:DNA replication protein DnaC